MMDHGVLPGAIKRFDWLVLPSGRHAKVSAIDEDCKPVEVSVVAHGAAYGEREYMTFTLPFLRKHCKRLPAFVPGVAR